MTGKYYDAERKDYQGRSDGKESEEHSSKVTKGCTGL